MARAGLQKRSFRIAGHATSVALEPEFWAALEEMARRQSCRLAVLVVRLDSGRGSRALASALRVAVLLDQERNKDCALS